MGTTSTIANINTCSVANMQPCNTKSLQNANSAVNFFTLLMVDGQEIECEVWASVLPGSRDDNGEMLPDDATLFEVVRLDTLERLAPYFDLTPALCGLLEGEAIEKFNQKNTQ